MTVVGRVVSMPEVDILEIEIADHGPQRVVCRIPFVDIGDCVSLQEALGDDAKNYKWEATAIVGCP